MHMNRFLIKIHHLEEKEMKRNTCLSILLVGAFLLIFTVSSALALTTTEKENLYNATLQELETYLENPNDPDKSLEYIIDHFEQLDNYEFSKQLRFFALALQQIENNIYDSKLDFYIDTLISNEKFNQYVHGLDKSKICTAGELSLYRSACEAQYKGDSEAAVAFYRQCNGFYDSDSRMEKLYGTAYQNNYDIAINYFENGDYNNAYIFFNKTRNYKDSDDYMTWIVGKLGYIPGESTPERVTSAPKREVTPVPYRQLYEGQRIYLGNYPQSSDMNSQSIEWYVIHVDGDHALLLSVKGLNAMAFDNNKNSWYNSEIKTWLNNGFTRTAFSSIEQNALDYYDPAGAKVFLLSEYEVNAYLSFDMLKCYVTPYAMTNKTQGRVSATVGKYGYAWWWLRDDGTDYLCTKGVKANESCDISTRGVERNRDFYTVRPAIWIDLRKMP